MSALKIKMVKQGGAIVTLDLAMEEAIEEVLQCLASDGYVMFTQATNTNVLNSAKEEILGNRVRLTFTSSSPLLTKALVCSSNTFRKPRRCYARSSDVTRTGKNLSERVNSAT